MTNVLNNGQLMLIIMLFFPGFVSIKTYSLFVATEQKDFTRDIFEVIAYSIINFALLSWLIYPIISNNLAQSNIALFSISLLFIFLICPALWPYVFYKIRKCEHINKYIFEPEKLPWDYVFSSGKAYWIIIHLRDGTKIGGIYGKDSRTSTFPYQRQIYLEKQWEIGEDNDFGEKIKHSDGVLVFEEDISFVELYKHSKK